MAHSLYAVKQGERCPRCNYRRDEYPHFRACVPRQKWPHSMADPERKTRVVVDGKVYDADKVPAHLQAVSGEAPAPGSRVLPDVADAGTPPPPEAAPDPRFVCHCGRVSKSAAGNKAHQRSHRES